MNHADCVPVRLSNRACSSLMRVSHALLACVLLLGLMARAMAHDPGLSTAQGVLRADTLELTTSFAPTDAQRLLPGAQSAPTELTPATFQADKPRWLAAANHLWEIRVGDAVLPPRDVRVELLAEDNVSFHCSFSLPPGANKITLRGTKFGDLPHGHRQFAIFTNDLKGRIVERLLSVSQPSVELSRFHQDAAGGTRVDETAAPGFWGFFKLGLRHIWSGYDHLLFLFGLLIVCRSFRSIVAIVSSFTIAHSLTLALATLDLVNVSPAVVEPAIAASIVFVAIENLWRRGEHSRSRLLVTFAFGLVHGFGFASVLRDLGVGVDGRSYAMPLFSFNLGLEVGQIVVAGIVLPVVWQLRKSEAFVRRGVPIASGVIAAAGLFWFLERTLF